MPTFQQPVTSTRATPTPVTLAREAAEALLRSLGIEPPESLRSLTGGCGWSDVVPAPAGLFTSLRLCVSPHAFLPTMEVLWLWTLGPESSVTVAELTCSAGVGRTRLGTLVQLDAGRWIAYAAGETG